MEDGDGMAESFRTVRSDVFVSLKIAPEIAPDIARANG